VPVRGNGGVQRGDLQHGAEEVRGATSERPVREPDAVTLSPQARHASEEDLGREGSQARGTKGTTTQGNGTEIEAQTEAGPVGRDGEPLTEAEQEQVDKLKARDAEVRTHELAHKAAAGQYATGGPTYSYQTGPDGKKYAVGGSVQIDTSPVKGDPDATIQKMAVVRRAALAPKEPSGQDRRVAAEADRKAAQARSEKIKADQGDEPETGDAPSIDAARETDGSVSVASEASADQGEASGGNAISSVQDLGEAHAAVGSTFDAYG